MFRLGVFYTYFTDVLFHGLQTDLSSANRANTCGNSCTLHVACGINVNQICSVYSTRFLSLILSNLPCGSIWIHGWIHLDRCKGHTFQVSIQSATSARHSVGDTVVSTILGHWDRKATTCNNYYKHDLLSQAPLSPTYTGGSRPSPSSVNIAKKVFLDPL